MVDAVALRAFGNRRGAVRTQPLLLVYFAKPRLVGFLFLSKRRVTQAAFGFVGLVVLSLVFLVATIMLLAETTGFTTYLDATRST